MSSQLKRRHKRRWVWLSSAPVLTLRLAPWVSLPAGQLAVLGQVQVALKQPGKEALQEAANRLSSPFVAGSAGGQ